jgi:hypothetical protein
MKKLIYTLFLLAVIKNVDAQVPGYQGKRFYVQEHFGSFLVINGLFQDDPYQGVTVPVRSELFANWVLGRHISFAISWATMLTPFVFERATITSASGENGVFKPTGQPMKARVNMFSGSFRLYFGNFLAPVGKYFQFGYGKAVFGMKKGTVIKGYYQSNYYASTSTSATISDPNTYSGNRFFFGFGKSNVHGKRLVTNLYAGFNFFADGSFERYRGYTDTKNYVRLSLSKAIRLHNLVELGFGFGYLIF